MHSEENISTITVHDLNDNWAKPVDNPAKLAKEDIQRAPKILRESVVQLLILLLKRDPDHYIRVNLISMAWTLAIPKSDIIRALMALKKYRIIDYSKDEEYPNIQLIDKNVVVPIETLIMGEEELSGQSIQVVEDTQVLVDEETGMTMRGEEVLLGEHLIDVRDVREPEDTEVIEVDLTKGKKKKPPKKKRAKDYVRVK